MAVRAEETTDMKLVRMAIFSNRPRRMKNFPKITKNGVPGGCGTPRIWAQAMNSPQSQNERVGAMVLKKTINGIKKLKAPRRIETILTTPSRLSTWLMQHLLKINQTLKISIALLFVNSNYTLKDYPYPCRHN
jgi:hypothetical protein